MRHGAKMIDICILQNESILNAKVGCIYSILYIYVNIYMYIYIYTPLAIYIPLTIGILIKLLSYQMQMDDNIIGNSSNGNILGMFDKANPAA